MEPSTVEANQISDDTVTECAVAASSKSEPLTVAAFRIRMLVLTVDA